MGAHEHAETASLYGRAGERKYLNRDERSRVLAGMRDLPPDQELFALTLAWSGARVSEVLALTPACIDLDSGVAAFVTLKRRRQGVMREVPLPPDLLAALDRHFGLSTAQRDLERATRRLWPWCRVTGWRMIKRVMIRAGVTGSRASPRGLRHAFAVGCLTSGVPLNLAQRWLGHARMETTAIYAAASGPEERALVAGFWRACVPRSCPARLEYNDGRESSGTFGTGSSDPARNHAKQDLADRIASLDDI